MATMCYCDVITFSDGHMVCWRSLSRLQAVLLQSSAVCACPGATRETLFLTTAWEDAVVMCLTAAGCAEVGAALHQRQAVARC